jgi:hypothetical protein
MRHDGAGSEREGEHDKRGEGQPVPVTSSHGRLRPTLRVGPGVVKAGRARTESASSVDR